jgi:transcriptional regulator with XRE-family HTH domain
MQGGFVMNIGERIKIIRKSKNISAAELAEKLNVSKTTIYRYENSSIEKIPVKTFNELCQILDVSPAELMGNTSTANKTSELPDVFSNAHDAIEFIIKTPTLAAYAGYNPDEMDDETIVEFANEILQQLKLVSYKFKTHER